MGKRIAIRKNIGKEISGLQLAALGAITMTNLGLGVANLAESYDIRKSIRQDVSVVLENHDPSKDLIRYQERNSYYTGLAFLGLAGAAGITAIRRIVQDPRQ